ncbi:MaoC/PaaZ C-terminal domain-containing protein [Xanthobacter flavus]|uniref:MaoC/PaaZ C-terminal domain-containing protein n=1 Tax=Xanthobacter flavus TaxID=281 RepID=UPI00372A13A7
MVGAGPQLLGRFTFTAEEIVRFARAYDPQPFHVDAEAAASSPFGGLIASGWHTASMWMGLFVRAHGAAAEGLPEDHAAVIAPVGVGFGMTDLKWLAPVRAGDTITFFTEILDARPSGSRPGWTIYHRTGSARREDGTEVMRFELKHLAPDAREPRSP